MRILPLVRHVASREADSQFLKCHKLVIGTYPVREVDEKPRG
jgi:hypothetical protein